MAPAADTAHPDADNRLRMLDAAMKRYRHAPDSLIEVLHTAQQVYGFLDTDCLKYVARNLQVPPSRVYGVATFYNIFSLQPRGEHTCVVCTGTACYVNGASAILSAIEHRHHLAVGATTADGKLSLVTARCLGACGMAPALVLDAEIAGGLTPEAAVARLDAWSRP